MSFVTTNPSALRDVVAHFRKLAELFKGTERGETYALMADQLEWHRKYDALVFTEEMRALMDAELYGVGYTIDGKYIDPKRVKRYYQQRALIFHDDDGHRHRRCY